MITSGCLSRCKQEFAEEGEHAGPGRLRPDQKASLVAQTSISRVRARELRCDRKVAYRAVDRVVPGISSAYCTDVDPGRTST